MTFESSDGSIVQLVAKYARFVGKGLVSPEEFVNKIFDEFAGNPEMQTQYATEVVKLIPQVARDRFARRVVAALRPGHLRRAFAMGGSTRSPEAEHEAAMIETARERAWMEAIHPLLVSFEEVE